MADDNAKNWISIAVPEQTVELAREDPRTYEDIIRAGLDAEPVDSVDVDALADAVAERVDG